MIVNRAGFGPPFSFLSGGAANDSKARPSTLARGLLRLTFTKHAGERDAARDPRVIRNRKREAKMTARIPLGRLGSADEVAKAVVFMVSEEAANIHGATLMVDGGLTTV